MLCALRLAPAKQPLLEAALSEVPATLCCTVCMQVSWLTQLGLCLVLLIQGGRDDSTYSIRAVYGTHAAVWLWCAERCAEEALIDPNSHLVFK